ncbi:alpha/beta-hydrolase [Polychaeton citri CBS 116435]|uniref:Carboxypeptidase n=1 Tax=Polychaeton citri CBS 116435 TaxID=1314669 RepID=A0A9P4UP31_9PEZI|nr:alpha/beta-hydrolase [Polychaeton citri CBS 116435]
MELFLFALTAAAALVAGHYPPPPTYDSIVKSPINPDVTISFKQPPAGTCTTAFTTQKQYTGYINIPPYTLAPIQQNYSINTFFWFVEARQTPETAPLTIWLNGGPGSSSMLGMFEENGPCEVIQMSDGTYGTQTRLWGWDRSSNILYIDQPNLVGFSYDEATNQTYDFLHQLVLDDDEADDAGVPDMLLRKGTFGSTDGQAPYQNTSWTATANTTEIAAQSTWHFLQSWLATFPQYNPAQRPNVTTPGHSADDPAGVHLFSESYGGKYGPAFAAYFTEQNERRANGSLPPNSSLSIQLESVGIINGIIDDLVQDFYYATFPYNNTLGIQAYSQTEELNAISAFSNAGGCADSIRQCRDAMSSTDPEADGDVDATNELCVSAQLRCALDMQGPYLNTGHDPYDIRQLQPSPDPPQAYVEYLNSAMVQAAIGARVNYTESNRYVQSAFISTGDTIRGGQLQDLADLVASGVRVALIYGDADWICNWFGGEAISLAVASLLPANTAPGADYSTSFPDAGYADIVINSSYIGGQVRQFANLSFSRIFNAGHFVPYFQPETAFTVFTRIIFGNDLATGEVSDLSSYGSEGPSSADYEQASSPTESATSASPTCWLRNINSTCTDDQIDEILAGRGSFSNGIYVSQDGSPSLPSSTVTGGVPGSPLPSNPSSKGGESTDGSDSSMKGGSGGDMSSRLTGVYTATSTPSQGGVGIHARPWAWLGEGRLELWPAVFMVFGLVGGFALVL